MAQRTSQPISEKDLRGQIDTWVTRALVDPDDARRLLSDPTVIVKDQVCGPQQYLSLLSIQAGTVVEFARQARALFWAVDFEEYLQHDVDLVPVSAAA